MLSPWAPGFSTWLGNYDSAARPKKERKEKRKEREREREKERKKENHPKELWFVTSVFFKLLRFRLTKLKQKKIRKTR